MTNPSMKKNKKTRTKTKKVGGVPSFLSNLASKASNARAAVSNKLGQAKAAIGNRFSKGTPTTPGAPAAQGAPAATLPAAGTPPPVMSQDAPAPISPLPVSSIGAGQQIPQGVNDAFQTMYKLISMLCILLVVLLFILGWIDVFSYIYNQSTQEYNMITDPNLFIEDTNEYEAFYYINNNTSDDEPYNIFLEESVVSYIYRFVGIFIMLLAVQYGLFFSFMLYSKFNQFPFNDTVTIDYKLLGIIISSFVCASIITAVYKKYFIHHAQGTLKNIRSQLRDMKINIYSNLTTNAEFLNAMIKNDSDALLSIFNAEIAKNNRNDCSSPTSNCDAEVQRMIFTYSLYTYYNDQIPQADPKYNTMQQIFTTENIQNRKIDPTLYFYYKQPIIISNMYPELLNANGSPFFKDTNRENVLLFGITNTIQNSNKKYKNKIKII